MSAVSASASLLFTSPTVWAIITLTLISIGGVFVNKTWLKLGLIVAATRTGNRPEGSFGIGVEVSNNQAFRVKTVLSNLFDGAVVRRVKSRDGEPRVVEAWGRVANIASQDEAIVRTQSALSDIAHHDPFLLWWHNR